MRDRLEQQLAALKRRKVISIWHDRDITAGAEWRQEIERELNEADLILLLISAAFLDSDFCASVELERAVARHQAGEALVIPVMLKPCDVEGTPVALLQQIPKNGKPITTWSNRDRAYLDAVELIKAAVEKWTSARPAKASPQDNTQGIAQGGGLAVQDPSALSPRLERVFGRDPYETAGWVQIGLSRANAVARIERESGMGVGTGFLVSAADLATGESDAPLLVTCSYVISPEEGGGRFKAVPYSAAIVNFELAGVRRRVESVVWSSPADELRTIVVRLSESVPGVQPCPVMTTPYRVQEFDDPKVAIIGHPRGGSVAFSLRDPAVLAANETLIHYRSATEPGSSGSPVFDWNSWRVIAVHSAGSETMQRLDGKGTYAANEGISIRAIVNAVGARTGRVTQKS